MEPGTWDEGREALQEFQRGHDEVGGAIAIRGFELPRRWCTAQAFVAQGRARDVATQPFEFLSLLGAAAHSVLQLVICVPHEAMNGF